MSDKWNADKERAYLRAEVAKRILKLRVGKGWNQSELARKVAVHMPSKKFGRDNISKYERKRVLPTPLHLAGLAKALGVEPADIMPNSKSRAMSQPIADTEMRIVGDGTVQLQINQTVPMRVGMQIMEMIDKARPQEKRR